MMIMIRTVTIKHHGHDNERNECTTDMMIMIRRTVTQ